MPVPSLPKSVRPWLRLSVRGIIVLVLVIGGWLGCVVRDVRIQRGAVAALKRAGAGVKYDRECNHGIPNPKGRPWAPRWLVDRIGVDYFGKVVYVVALTRGIDNSVFAPLGRLKWLERLNLTGTAVTEAGLARLEGLTHLRTLDLSNATGVGDAGLAHLKGLASPAAAS